MAAGVRGEVETVTVEYDTPSGSHTETHEVARDPVSVVEAVFGLPPPKKEESIFKDNPADDGELDSF